MHTLTLSLPHVPGLLAVWCTEDLSCQQPLSDFYRCGWDRDVKLQWRVPRGHVNKTTFAKIFSMMFIIFQQLKLSYQFEPSDKAGTCLRDLYNCSNAQSLSLCKQQCLHGKNRPITCPEIEWCHNQYTFCNFAARYRSVAWRLETIALKRILRTSV